jgi:16S rRNA G1207 methylase RsmC
VQAADLEACAVLGGPWLDESDSATSAAPQFDFCMCNPPFFASMAEAATNPATACRGQQVRD